MSPRALLAGVASLAVIAIAAGAAFARDDVGPTAAAPVRIDNFRLNDNHGFAQDLKRLVDVKAIVLVAQVNGDAAGRKAAKAAEALQKAHPDVAFFMLNSRQTDTREAIAAEAKTQGYAIPVLRDDLQLVGEQLGVTYAGEAFVVEPKTLKVLYHGPVEGAAKAGSVAAALADIKAQRAVAISAGAGAKGAAIAFPERGRTVTATYVKDIAPILEAKCVTCHQTGGIGPFAMTDYTVVKGFAPMIREAVRTRTMPPWHPDPAVGKFVHEQGLTPEQTRTLVHWVEAGAPRGDGEDPLASVKHVAPEWPLGTPDLVINVPKYTIPASGVVDYQFPTASNPLTEGRWVKAATLMPGSRQGTHHILSGYISGTPKAGPASSTQWEASYGEYAVGGESFVLPEKMGIMLPAGGSMGFQMHYTPFGKEAVDASKMGFYFYPKGQEPDRVMRHYVIANNLIELPPNDDNHKEVAYTTFPKDAMLYQAFLHTHYRGRAGRLELVKPDGSMQTLISLPRYDFNWQRTYTFAEPIKVPAGSKIVATYWYDNSVRNPSNPDPSKSVVWGPQSWEEMHYTSLYFQWSDETAARPADATKQMGAIPMRIMGMLDTNLDGKVSKDELRGRVAAALGPHFTELDANKDGVLDASELAMGVKYVMPLVLAGSSRASVSNPTP